MNSLGNAIMSTEDGKAKYDAKMKEVLSNKQILARILKRFVPEYEKCTLEEIENVYIEPESILVSSLGVGRNSSSIEGIRAEDKTDREGTIYYDIMFHACYPGKADEKIGLYINVEAQNAYYKGYPIEMRGVYYAARRLTTQLGDIGHGTNYGSLQKVYSIWICMGDVPNYEANTASLYAFDKCDLIGNVKRERESYDLLSVVILRINDKVNSKDETLAMLQTLCSNQISREKKLNDLSNMGIRVDRELREGVNSMCNLSDLVETRGIEREKKANAVAFLKDGVSYEQVSRVLKVPIDTLKEWEREANTTPNAPQDT